MYFNIYINFIGGFHNESNEEVSVLVLYRFSGSVRR